MEERRFPTPLDSSGRLAASCLIVKGDSAMRDDKQDSEKLCEAIQVVMECKSVKVRQ